MAPYWIPKKKPTAAGRDSPDAWLQGEGALKVKAGEEVEFVYVEDVDGEQKKTTVLHRVVQSGEALAFENVQQK